MSFDPTKHDMGLLRQDDSTKIGLMLVRDKNNSPQYMVVDDEYLIQQQAAVPGYDNLQAEKEIRVGATSHRSGFGLDVYDATDPERYLSSTNMDLRFRNMAICGPKATAIATMPSKTAPAITDAGFEIWASGTDLTNWTEAKLGTNSAITQESTIKRSAPYSVKLWSDDLAGSYAQVTQALATTQIKGRRFTVTVYVQKTHATYSQCRVGISDGVDATVWSDYGGGTSSFTAISVTKTLSQTATQLQITCQANRGDGGEGGGYFDDISITRNSYGYPVVFEEFNSLLYLGFSGGLLAKMDSDGDEFTGVYEFANGITDLEAFVGDKLYIALGGSNVYYYMSTAGAFTASTDTEGKADFFQKVEDTMWKAIKPYTLMSATDPTNPGEGTNWSTTTTVDTSTYNITDLISDGSSLYIPKEDRCFYLDSAGAVKVLIDASKSITCSTSGKNSFAWNQTQIYYPCGTQSLIEYDAGAITWRSPSKYCTNLSAFNGRVQALAGDEEWLFAILDNGDYVEVLAGREETIDSTTKWIWHPISQFALTGCETAFVSSIFQKRLWIASTSSADKPYYIKLYTGYGNPTGDTNRYFQTGGHFITPWLHGEFRGDNKVWIKLTLTMEDVDTDVYFKAYYQLLGDDDFSSSIGNFKTVPKTTHYITTATDNVISNKTDIYIRFKIEAVCTTSATPVLKGYDCRAILYPTKRNIISATVKCDDEVEDKDGNHLDDSADTIATALREAKNATGLVTIWDITGTAKYCKVLPHPNFEQIIETEKDRVIKRVFNLLLQEVALS